MLHEVLGLRRGPERSVVAAPVSDAAAYATLDADDRARLVALHASLAPVLGPIADAFYAATQANARTAGTLTGAEQIARHRGFVMAWMSSGLLGPYDDAFAADRAQIARQHVELGLGPHHMVIAISVIRRAYRDQIAASCSASEAHAVGSAVDKLLDLELAVMLRAYQRTSEDRLLADERQRRLEQVEAMQTLCAGLAHEVRNPLNSAKLQLELAERRARRGGDEPRLVEPIELAGHELDRLTTLLDEFLAFARPHPLDARLQDVGEVVREVVEHERPRAVARGAALTLTLTGAGTRGDLDAEVDASKVREIVGSLVRNAIEAVTAGGHVAVCVEAGDRHVHIRVRDDGAGIPAEVLPRIYEPFFSTKEGGTGMGMSIVHSLIALHHGTIQVASSPGGTTFDVALPRRIS